MPSNTPLGTATISVTFNNQSTIGLNSATINVVASSVGIFTPGATGLGPGIFTDALTGALITLANPATADELLTGWATGVGALAGADSQVATSFPNFPGVQVWVGGQAAKMSYAGRSGCCVAVDQLNFYVPRDLSGCNVPVFVASSGRTSATTTIPITATAGSPCSDSGPVLPSTLTSKAAAGTPLKLGLFVVAPSSGSQPAARRPQEIADRLSAAFRVPVSVADAAKIMRAAEAHNSRALKSALANYSEQWKALSSRAKAQLAEAVVGSQQLLATAFFLNLTNEAFAAAAVSAQLPPPGSCALPPSPFPDSLNSTQRGLDAGASLSLVGAGGSLTLQKQHPGDYATSFSLSPAAGAIPVGSYTLSGGGSDVGAFSVTVNVAGHPTLTNKASLASIDRSKPLTVTWSGGTPGQFVMIGGYSNHANTGLPPQVVTANRGFTCAEAAEKGALTIPSYILQGLWPTPDAHGAIFISYGAVTQPVNIPGLDAAWFVDGSFDEVTKIVFK